MLAVPTTTIQSLARNSRGRRCRRRSDVMGLPAFVGKAEFFLHSPSKSERLTRC